MSLKAGINTRSEKLNNELKKEMDKEMRKEITILERKEIGITVLGPKHISSYTKPDRDISLSDLYGKFAVFFKDIMRKGYNIRLNISGSISGDVLIGEYAASSFAMDYPRSSALDIYAPEERPDYRDTIARIGNKTTLCDIWRDATNTYITSEKDLMYASNEELRKERVLSMEKTIEVSDVVFVLYNDDMDEEVKSAARAAKENGKRVIPVSKEDIRSERKLVTIRSQSDINPLTKDTLNKVIKGDMLNVGQGLIVHQVNCKGVMGAGLAKQIRERYPDVYNAYKSYCNEHKEKALGTHQAVRVNENLSIVNLFGQNGYGRTERQTDYEAFRSGLRSLRKRIGERQIPIYFPYGIGCGLAGGSWEVIQGIIFKYFPEAVIYKL